MPTVLQNKWEFFADPPATNSLTLSFASKRHNYAIKSNTWHRIPHCYSKPCTRLSTPHNSRINCNTADQPYQSIRNFDFHFETNSVNLPDISLPLIKSVACPTRNLIKNLNVPPGYLMMVLKNELNVPKSELLDYKRFKEENGIRAPNRNCDPGRVKKDKFVLPLLYKRGAPQTLAQTLGKEHSRQYPKNEYENEPANDRASTSETWSKKNAAKSVSFVISENIKQAHDEIISQKKAIVRRNFKDAKPIVKRSAKEILGCAQKQKAAVKERPEIHYEAPKPLEMELEERDDDLRPKTTQTLFRIKIQTAQELKGAMMKNFHRLSLNNDDLASKSALEFRQVKKASIINQHIN